MVRFPKFSKHRQCVSSWGSWLGTVMNSSPTARSSPTPKCWQPLSTGKTQCGKLKPRTSQQNQQSSTFINHPNHQQWMVGTLQNFRFIVGFATPMKFIGHHSSIFFAIHPSTYLSVRCLRMEEKYVDRNVGYYRIYIYIYVHICIDDIYGITWYVDASLENIIF